MRTFWKKGYTATTLDELSRTTGLVRPSLNGAFGSKRDMYLMSMDVYLEHLASARQALSAAPSAQAALEAFYLRMLDLYFEKEGSAHLGCFLVGTALAEATGDAELREATLHRLKMLTETLSAALSQRNPDASPEDICFAAEQAGATLHSLAVRTRAGERKEPLAAFARQSAQSIARSLNAAS